MAAVQLRLRRERTHDLGSKSLHLEQLMVLLRIVVPNKHAVLRDAVFDTGAPFSVFPQSAWEIFEPTIRWLSALSEEPLA